MSIPSSSPTDPPVGQRQHRQDEHRGLPVATQSRNGYLSAIDKRLLDGLRASGVPVVTPPTTTDTAALDAAIEEVKALLPSGAAKDLNVYLKADGSQALTGDMSVSAGKKIDGIDLSAHDHAAGGGLQVDHGGLGGLADDDHSQYHNNARGDARYSVLAHVHAYSALTGLPAGCNVVNLLPNVALLGGTTPPVLTRTTGTNFPYHTLDFIDGARGMAYWQIPVPSNYDGSPIGVRLAFVLGTNLNLVVRMDCNAGVPISDAPWDAAMAATGVNGSRNYGVGAYTAGDLYTLNTTWSTALPTANSFVIFGFGRDGAHAADTCTDTVKLLGIRLTFPGVI